MSGTEKPKLPRLSATALRDLRNYETRTSTKYSIGGREKSCVRDKPKPITLRRADYERVKRDGE